MKNTLLIIAGIFALLLTSAQAGEIAVKFTNKTNKTVKFFLNGGAGLETKLAAGASEKYTMTVDKGEGPCITIHNAKGGKDSVFTLTHRGHYEFLMQNGAIVNAYE